MPKQVIARLSSSQQAALVRLFNRPNYTGTILRVTGEALVRRGYVARHRDWSAWAWPGYTLTQAGIRYNQNGKLIGE